MTTYGSESQESDPQHFGQKQESVRTWGVLNLQLNGVPCQKNEDKLWLPKNCTDSTYGDMKKQYDPALSAKDPDQENNNEGARPMMQVWKLLQDPRGAEPPPVKSANIILQVKLLC